MCSVRRSTCSRVEGFEATGIRELGAAVGLNSATLYHYAGGKQELLAEIMRRCLTELLDCGRAARASSQARWNNSRR